MTPSTLQVKALAALFLLLATYTPLSSEPLGFSAPPPLLNPQWNATPLLAGAPAAPAAAAAVDPVELAFLSLINQYRDSKGLGALEINSKLQAAAEWMSQDMADKNYFSHTDSLGREFWKRLLDFGYPENTFMGENIAAGYATAQAVFDGWKNSPGHNANMLGANYKVIGIGAYFRSGSTYGWYWTTDFGSVQTDPPGDKTPPQAPRRLRLK